MINRRNFTNTLLAIFFCISSIAPAFGATQKSKKDSPAAQIDKILSDSLDDTSPGAAVAVIHNGQIVYQNAFGLADLERQVKISTNSVFELGSIAKQFTAMCILLLENDGRLSLDDDIRKYIPEMPSYKNTVTLRHLINHTSGIRDIETLLPLAGWPYENYYTEKQLLELITRQKGLNFSTNDKFLYSNSGYLLLAKVVDRVSGKSLRSFAEERIFIPLGMEQTEFWDDPAQLVKNRALAYTELDGGKFGLAMWNLPFAGPAGLYSSVGDLALWDANFYKNNLGGGNALIERMQTPDKLNNGELITYAGGLFLSSHQDFPVIEHGGAWMGYRSVIKRFPEQHLSVILLSNRSSINTPVQAIIDIYLPKTSKDKTNKSANKSPGSSQPKIIKLTTEQLGRFENLYWNESEKLMRRIEIREGKLQYTRSANSSTELAAERENSFIMLDVGDRVVVEFPKIQENGKQMMTVAVPQQKTLEFSPVELFTGNLRDDYIGNYWSEELQRTLMLSVKKGKAQVTWADVEQPFEGFLVKEDKLVVQNFIAVPWYPQAIEIVFDRNKKGSILGFTLSSTMVSGIKFIKTLK